MKPRRSTGSPIRTSSFRLYSLPISRPLRAAICLTKGFPNHIKTWPGLTAELAIPYDRTNDFQMPMHFYFGPNNFKALKRIGFHLQDLVTIGGSIIRWMNAWVIIPIFNFLNRFISNYGIIILLLTLIIKLALLPLTYKSYMSQAKMRVLKPEIEEINAKIPKDKAMERQQATMALYKKAGVNPMGGCLPMVFQMPILVCDVQVFPNIHRAQAAALPLGSRPVNLRFHHAPAVHHPHVWRPCESFYPADDGINHPVHENEQQHYRC